MNSCWFALMYWETSLWRIGRVYGDTVNWQLRLVTVSESMQFISTRYHWLIHNLFVSSILQYLIDFCIPRPGRTTEIILNLQIFSFWFWVMWHEGYHYNSKCINILILLLSFDLGFAMPKSWALVYGISVYHCCVCVIDLL